MSDPNSLEFLVLDDGSIGEGIRYLNRRVVAIDKEFYVVLQELLDGDELCELLAGMARLDDGAEATG